MSKKVLVLLSGCGVFDGSEIHESVLCLLELSKRGIDYQCVAPNILQHHVLNHTNGEEMPEARNVFIESARIARGNIIELSKVNASDYSGLVMPGGFGAAKNWTTWAFNGSDCDINHDVKRIILENIENKLPIMAICMSPTVIAKALQGSMYKANLTVGTTQAKSPYDIKAISEGITATGNIAQMKMVNEIAIDTQLKIITSPCYMMEASISEIALGISTAMDTFEAFLKH
jgi:enhancing lycopene biosynthesis protein 2